VYTLASDEKATTVMLYSRNKLIHGDFVTKKDIRVSIWPRADKPTYMHLWNAEVLFMAGTPPKSLKYSEFYFPTERIIGFHVAPPASEPLDYDASVENRTMLAVAMTLGAFMLRGKMRMSTRTDFASMLEIAHRTWISIYDADITNPFLPIMPTIHVPMILVSPAQVSFGL
jgi:hypothetical protein